jgi:hypothetical protein
MKPYLIPAALLLIAVASSALAASGTVLRTDKLYSQPSATAKVAGSVTKGASVNVLAKQGGWLRVTAGKTTGWMRLLSVRIGAGGLSNSGLGDVVGAATTKSDPSRVVAVAGLRGLNEEELKHATFNAEELSKLDLWTVTPAQSKRFASQADLVAVQVPMLVEPKSMQKPTSSWGDNE